jgi:Undecaprenyl-phosphate galactose phosphotransferase WbaP
MLFLGVKIIFILQSSGIFEASGILEAAFHNAASAALLLLAGFYIEFLIRRALIKSKHWGTPTLIIGSGRRAHEIWDLLVEQPELGFRPVGLVRGAADDAGWPTGSSPVPTLSDPSHLARLNVQVEAAVLTAPSQRETLHALCAGHVPLPREFLAGDAEGLQSLWLQTRTLGHHFAVEITNDRHLAPYLCLKRALDLAIAIPTAILLLPLIGVLVIAVKCVDPGPAFYVQKRIGRDGRIVTVVKIRSMYVDAEQRLEHHLRDNPAARVEWERRFKLCDDPRILTIIGTFIRRSSLDELPQLWNIIRGEMSLIGPRPLPAYHAMSFDEEFQKIRASVTPGLTGLWQVTTRSDGDLTVLKAQDLFYIKNRSIWLDLFILLQTVPAVLSGNGAR